MSILSAGYFQLLSALGMLAATPTTSRAAGNGLTTGQMLAGFIILAGFIGSLALGLFFFIRFRIYSQREIVGPLRLPPEGGIWRLLVSLLIGFFVYAVVSWAYVGIRKSQGLDFKSGNLDSFGLLDRGILMAIPPLGLFLGVVLFGLAMRDGWLDRLGFSFKKLPVGLRAGFVGAVVIIPLVIITMIVSNILYLKFNYNHAKEHPIIEDIQKSKRRMEILMQVVAAVIAAPLAEEFIFRAHFQTMFRQFFMMMSRATRGASDDHNEIIPMASVVVGPARVLPMQDWKAAENAMAASPMSSPDLAGSPTIELNYSQARPPRPLYALPWHGWMAVILTSVLFALVHQLWTAPAIFVLSVGMGYAYERTGSLWASITMHFLFNGIQLALLFVQMYG